MFTKIDENTVEYDGNKYILQPIGINSDELIKISSHLEDTYNMKIKRIEYHTNELIENPRTVGKIYTFREIQEFIIPQNWCCPQSL